MKRSYVWSAPAVKAVLQGIPALFVGSVMARGTWIFSSGSDIMAAGILLLAGLVLTLGMAIIIPLEASQGLRRRRRWFVLLGTSDLLMVAMLALAYPAAAVAALLGAVVGGAILLQGTRG